MAEESDAAVDRLTDPDRGAMKDLDAFCDFCDIPLVTCIHGNPPTKVLLDRLVRTGPTIEAQFSSTDCAGCGKRITAGTEITMTADGWAHAAEVDEPEPDSTFEGIL